MPELELEQAQVFEEFRISVGTEHLQDIARTQVLQSGFLWGPKDSCFCGKKRCCLSRRAT